MNGNLAGSPFESKQSLRLSRSSARLVGWIKYRLSKSSKPWIQLCLPTFCKTTGIGLRTARRSLQKIRQCPQTEIVARTINEAGRWKILVSSSVRLQGLKRSEPFAETASGAKRVIKDQIRGKTIKKQQLFLNEDPLMWKAKSNDRMDDTHEVNTSDSKSDRKQMTMFRQFASTQNNNVWTSNTECHFWDRHTKGGFSKEKQRCKHGQADFEVKTRNLAWWIARNDLQREHWDNCKVKHTMRHGFTFALQELRRGCNRQTIVKAYSMALHEIHAVAVDSGVTEEASWQPSSTISRARKILIDGECRGKWWARITNQRQNVLVSGNTQSTSGC